jgi:hypothetical protein
MAMLVMVLVSILERAGDAAAVGVDIKNTPFLNLTAERPCLPGVKTNKEVRSKRAETAHIVLHTSSSIRTITVGPGVSPGQRTHVKCPVADFTASGEFHPALKTSYPVVCKHYTTQPGKMQPPISGAGQIVDKLKNFGLPSMQTVKNILK